VVLKVVEVVASVLPWVVVVVQVDEVLAAADVEVVVGRAVLVLPLVPTSVVL
jgi:hypothetical protein